MDLKERFLANKSDEKQEQRLQRSRERLLFLSRHSINAGLQGLTFEEYSDKNFDKKSSPFNVIKKEWGNVKDKGVRVVLYSKRELQGSYGTLKSTDNVYEDVINFSRISAFNDERFPPITNNGFKSLSISIFLVDDKEELIVYNDPLELTMLLKNTKHKGVLIRKDNKQSYFLPDAWDLIPDPGMFLSSLCVNASLPSAAWKGEKRVWPQKIKERKRDLYSGKIIEPEEYSGIDVYQLNVDIINGTGK